MTYELIDYNLKDKLCNDSGKCNSFSTKTFYIKLNATNISSSFNLKFNFKVFYNFTYTNFKNTYVSGVLSHETVAIDLSKDAPKLISIKSDDYIEYDYSENILILHDVSCDLEIVAVTKQEYTFAYTGNYQAFTVPYTGKYKIELWGASGGGNSSKPAGLGGYTSGDIILEADKTMYIYVGGQGQAQYIISNPGGYNGGGYGGQINEEKYSCGGGGSTDIRLLDGTWNNFNSLKSRIMVAGGGGGNVYSQYTTSAGYGGGLIGGTGTGPGGPDDWINSVGGTQTLGGYGYYDFKKGLFGYSPQSTTAGWGGGGGGGYYAGAVGHGTAGSGGSSFVSGHDGCNTIEESSTEYNIIHTNQSIHYSKYKFNNTKIVDGTGYNWTTSRQSYIGMPTHDGAQIMSGNSGNGYAKITLLDTIIRYNITYTNIVGNYITSIKKDKDLVVDFGDNAPFAVNVLVDGKPIDYTYENGIVTVKKVNADIEIKGVSETNVFDYTGQIQSYKVPVSGTYKIEVWGASGGYGYDSTRSTGGGGYGGYSTGHINLDYDQNLYIAIGGAGESNCQNITCAGGYNGGSESYRWVGGNNLWTGGGGGATHVAFSNKGELKNYSSNKTDIIIVAGGGGGADFFHWTTNSTYADGVSSGGSGGGFKGVNGKQTTDSKPNIAGTQESGYNFGTAGTTYSADSIGGSGGGWYGGTSSEQHVPGAGGSGYIGNTSLTNKHMTCFNCETSTTESTKTNSTTCKSETAISDCSKLGNGYAKITLLTVK